MISYSSNNINKIKYYKKYSRNLYILCLMIIYLFMIRKREGRFKFCRV